MRCCKVLFICLGNICRSPTAQAVFEKKISERKLETLITVDSCGTGSWHLGKMPDSRAVEMAGKRGYSLSHLRARKIESSDFENFDYLIVMDRENLKEVTRLLPDNFQGNLVLFSSFIADSAVVDIPDPYYGGRRGFDNVINLVEMGCSGLLKDILGD